MSDRVPFPGNHRGPHLRARRGQPLPEAGYTLLARGRLSNNLYVTATDNPTLEIDHLRSDTV